MAANQHVPRHVATSLRYMKEANLWAQRHQALAQANELPKGQRNPVAPPVSTGFFASLNRDPFSNHSMVPTTYRGVRYLSSEHAYLTLQARCYGMDRLADVWQAGQGHHRVFNQWYNAANPKSVKSWSTKEFRYFRNNEEDPKRQHWLATRNQVMFEVVKAKFSGNPQARKTLLETGHQYLAELSPSDKHWGVAEKLTPQQLDQRVRQQRPSKGRNQLGLILMAVREILKRKSRQRLSLTVRTARYLAKRAMRYQRPTRAYPALEAQLRKEGHPPTAPDDMQRTLVHFRMQLMPEARALARTTWYDAPLPLGVRVVTAARRHPGREGQFSFRVDQLSNLDTTDD
jgi:ribA/ribD-fused uncharacterized protein